MKFQSLATLFTFALLMSSLAAPLPSSADETVTTTSKTTSYSGVVSQIDPGSSTIMLKSDASATPTTYSYTKQTTFVDPSGRTVSYEAVRNAPVTIEYTNDGGRMIVTKVVQTGPSVVVPAAPAMQRKTVETHTEETR